MNLPRVTDVVQRVRIQDDQICPFSRLNRADLWINFRHARSASRCGDNHLHGGHAGLDHHLHLDVLEIALPTAGITLGSTIGTHSNLNARVRENFQVANRLFERWLDGLGLFVVANLLLGGGTAEVVYLFLIKSDAPTEERLVKEGGSRFVYKYGQVARQRRDVANVPSLELRSELQIDVLVANAVRQNVAAFLNCSFRIL